MSSIPFLLFLFLLQNLPVTFHLLLCSSKTKKKNFALLIKEKRETKTEREEKDWERSAWASTATPASPPPLVVLPTNRLGSDRPPPFFFFFFSYLLILIQLYFKNWILFCVLCFVFGLCEKRRE